MTQNVKHTYGNVIAIILLILILIAVFYGFKEHIVVFNSCYFANSTLAGSYSICSFGIKETGCLFTDSITATYPAHPVL